MRYDEVINTNHEHEGTQTMTQTRIGFINEHGMNLEELSARTVVTNCAGDFVDDFDMDAVEDDYEAARDAVVEAVRPDLYFSWYTNEIMGEVGTDRKSVV